MRTPINAARLKVIESNFSDIYGRTLVQQVPISAGSVSTFTADSYVLSDIYVGQMPPLRPWEGKRKGRAPLLLDSAYAGVSKETMPFESTVEVSRRDILADRLGVYNTAVANAAVRVVSHLDIQATRALENSTATHKQYVNFDGKAVFATDHKFDPAKPAGQSNLFTMELSGPNFAAALAAAKSWTGNESLPIFAGFVEKPTLRVHPSQEALAKSIVENPGIATSDAITSPWNPNYGMAKLLVDPYMTEPNAWYIELPLNGLRPLAMYEFMPPEFTIRMDLSDPLVYETNTFSFGAYADTHTFIPNWFQCLKSNPENNLYTGTTIR